MRAMLLGLIFTLASQGVDVQRISQQDFKKLFDARSVVVVDTRNETSFSSSHIPGAVLLPLEGRATWPEQYEKTVSSLLTAQKPVVTYCA
jgi:rhodanese-related sulfurtransferase